MDAPSTQLQGNLDESIRRALTSQRPVLTHLNADTSWLLQLPYPPNAGRPRGRSRWNLILDPWFVVIFLQSSATVSKIDITRLLGPQSDVARFFSTQWHTVEPCVKDMPELSRRLQDIEARLQSHDVDSRSNEYSDPCFESDTTYIDAVVISHEFTDHCNKRTLLQLNRDTPVFATRRAADTIRSWRHFEFVQDVPSFFAKDFDWRNASLYPLPNWLGISQMTSPGDALDYHSAILLTFNISPVSSSTARRELSPAEGIVYTPHGIRAPELRYLPAAFPPIRTLVLLHGLHDIKISVHELNLGAHNGLQAQRICQAKYWVSTHDEIKKATGFITPWLHRNELTLQEALNREREVHGMVGDESGLTDVRGVTFADLASGESLLLG